MHGFAAVCVGMDTTSTPGNTILRSTRSASTSPTPLIFQIPEISMRIRALTGRERHMAHFLEDRIRSVDVELRVSTQTASPLHQSMQSDLSKQIVGNPDRKGENQRECELEKARNGLPIGSFPRFPGQLRHGNGQSAPLCVTNSNWIIMNCRTRKAPCTPCRAHRVRSVNVELRGVQDRTRCVDVELRCAHKNLNQFERACSRTSSTKQHSPNQ